MSAAAPSFRPAGESKVWPAGTVVHPGAAARFGDDIWDLAALKTTVPGASVLETQLAPDLPGGTAELETLPGVHRVQKQGEAIYRIFSDHGPNAAEALMELARRSGIEIKTLSIQSTTLDDVFLHFTGRGLHEADAVPARGGMGRTAPF